MPKEIRLQHTSDGTPFVRVYLGTNRVTGKKMTRYRLFRGMSDDEAREAAERWLAELDEGHAGGLTDKLGERLTRYLEYLQADGRSFNTVKTYRTLAGYCRPLASVPVSKVTPMDLDDLYTLLLTKGLNGHPLSHATVRSFRAFLQGAFKHFVTQGLIERNPVPDSMRINVTRTEAIAFDEATLQLVSLWLSSQLSERPENRIGIVRRNAAMAIYLGLYTGARVGEICALRRRDVRMADRTMTIAGTVADTDHGPVRQGRTKGKKPRNVAILERNVKPLSEHIAWQDGYLGTHGPSTPIITVDGSYASPDAVSRQFERMRRELGLDDAYHMHSLRHTHATYLLQNGCDMRTVQERLGHSRVDTTLQLYGHVLPGRDAKAAEDFGRVMDGFS